MNGELTVGSLFSGIGGFDLGFERAGMRTVWFCEQDEFCRRVLAKHWPGVPCYPDVRAIVANTERGDAEPRQGKGHGLLPAAHRAGAHDHAGGAGEDGGGGGMVPVPVPYVDVLCGGFPCQDISLAGKGAGIDGSRSGLWSEFARIIGELRPRYVVVENVPAITSRGLDRVLGDLAARGFDAEWDHIPASAVGAPHRRDRFWLVAYPDDSGRGPGLADVHARQPDVEGRGLADPSRDGAAGRGQETGPVGERVGTSGERGAACGCPWHLIDAGGFCACCEAHIDDPRGLYALQGDGTHRYGHGSDTDGGGRQVEWVAEPAGEQGARRRVADGLCEDGRQHDAAVADADGAGCGERRRSEPVRPQQPPVERGGQDVADAAARDGGDGRRRERVRDLPANTVAESGQTWPVSTGGGERSGDRGGATGPEGAWLVEPDVGRVADGVPARVDRLRSLGNALVPQIAEWIGRRIVEFEGG